MMKKICKSLWIFALLLTLGSWQYSQAQVTITQWNFENEDSIPSAGVGIAHLVGGITSTYATGVGGGKAWNTAGYPAQGTASGTAGVEFLVSTSGFEGIMVNWEQRHSNTSANRIRLQYTINGTDWLNFEADATNATNMVTGVDKGFDNGRYITADAGTVWFQRSANLSAIEGAGNNPVFGVRMVSEFVDGTQYGAALSTSNYGSAGTLRYDNVTFAGAENSPTITATPMSLTGFTYEFGNGPSANQTVRLNALNLNPPTGIITVTSSDVVEISTDDVSFSNLLELPYSNGEFPVEGVEINVRMVAGLSIGNHSGLISVTGGLAPELLINASGAVTQPVGIDSPTTEPAKIFAYGNILHIDMNSPVNGQINLINLYGQQVEAYPLNGSKADISPDVPAGIYIVSIVSQSGTQSARVWIR